MEQTQAQQKKNRKNQRKVEINEAENGLCNAFQSCLRGKTIDKLLVSMINKCRRVCRCINRNGVWEQGYKQGPSRVRTLLSTKQFHLKNSVSWILFQENQLRASDTRQDTMGQKLKIKISSACMSLQMKLNSNSSDHLVWKKCITHFKGIGNSIPPSSPFAFWGHLLSSVF